MAKEPITFTRAKKAILLARRNTPRSGRYTGPISDEEWKARVRTFARNTLSMGAFPAPRVLTCMDPQKHGDENGYEIWGARFIDGWQWWLRLPSGANAPIPDEFKPITGYSHARHVAANLPTPNSANPRPSEVSCQEEPNNAE